MRRTFCALCTACVAIMRSWIVSRTASAVATHQSRGVAEPAWRASVETRWRWMSERSTSPVRRTSGLWMEPAVLKRRRRAGWRPRLGDFWRGAVFLLGGRAAWAKASLETKIRASGGTRHAYFWKRRASSPWFSSM